MASVLFAWELGAGLGHMLQLLPLARTVRDAAALLDAMSGPMPGDPHWAPPPARSFLSTCDEAPGRLRIGRYCDNGMLALGLDPECAAAYESAPRTASSFCVTSSAPARGDDRCRRRVTSAVRARRAGRSRSRRAARQTLKTMFRRQQPQRIASQTPTKASAKASDALRGASHEANAAS